MKDRDTELPTAGNSRYSTSVIVRNTIGFMTAGDCNYADIEKFHSDFYFTDSGKFFYIEAIQENREEK